MEQQKSTSSIEQYDERRIYCRMLGHELPFSYCRSTADGRFCPRIFDCWHGKIDVGRFIQTHFSDDEIREIIHPSAPKMHTLLNLIRNSEKTG